MASFTLPPWHPTMPNVVLTDMQLILQWEAQAKEVWEETAMSHALHQTRAMYQFRYATMTHARCALNLVRYGGLSYTNVVSEIASKITEWQKANPFAEEMSKDDYISDYELDMEYERQLAGY